MARKQSSSKTPIRELPKETQLEIKRRQAKLAQAAVDKADAAAEIEKNRAEIQKLREG